MNSVKYPKKTVVGNSKNHSTINPLLSGRDKQHGIVGSRLKTCKNYDSEDFFISKYLKRRHSNSVSKCDPGVVKSSRHAQPDVKLSDVAGGKFHGKDSSALSAKPCYTMCFMCGKEFEKNELLKEHLSVHSYKVSYDIEKEKGNSDVQMLSKISDTKDTDKSEKGSLKLLTEKCDTNDRVVEEVSIVKVTKLDKTVPILHKGSITSSSEKAGHAFHSPQKKVRNHTSTSCSNDNSNNSGVSYDKVNHVIPDRFSSAGLPVPDAVSAVQSSIHKKSSFAHAGDAVYRENISIKYQKSLSPKTRKSHLCITCGKVFILLDSFVQHMKKEHGKEVKEILPNSLYCDKSKVVSNGARNKTNSLLNSGQVIDIQPSDERKNEIGQLCIRTSGKESAEKVNPEVSSSAYDDDNTLSFKPSSSTAQCNLTSAPLASKDNSLDSRSSCNQVKILNQNGFNSVDLPGFVEQSNIHNISSSTQGFHVVCKKAIPIEHQKSLKSKETEKSHLCKICGKIFQLLACLVQHLEKDHGDKGKEILHNSVFGQRSKTVSDSAINKASSKFNTSQVDTIINPLLNAGESEESQSCVKGVREESTGNIIPSLISSLVNKNNSPSIKLSTSTASVENVFTATPSSSVTFENISSTMNSFSSAPLENTFTSTTVHSSASSVNALTHSFASAQPIFMNTPYSCPICFKKLSKKYVQRHLKIHHRKPYMCTFCAKLFESQYELDDHISKFHKPKEKQCKGDVFGETFKGTKHFQVNEKKGVTQEESERSVINLSTEKNFIYLSTEKSSTDLSTVKNVTNLSKVKSGTDLSTEKNVIDLSTEENITDLSSEKNVMDLPANLEKNVDLSTVTEKRNCQTASSCRKIDLASRLKVGKDFENLKKMENDNVKIVSNVQTVGIKDKCFNKTTGLRPVRSNKEIVSNVLCQGSKIIVEGVKNNNDINSRTENYYHKLGVEKETIQPHFSKEKENLLSNVNPVKINIQSALNTHSVLKDSISKKQNKLDSHDNVKNRQNMDVTDLKSEMVKDDFREQSADTTNVFHKKSKITVEANVKSNTNDFRKTKNSLKGCDDVEKPYKKPDLIKGKIDSLPNCLESNAEITSDKDIIFVETVPKETHEKKVRKIIIKDFKDFSEICQKCGVSEEGEKNNTEINVRAAEKCNITTVDEREIQPEYGKSKIKSQLKNGVNSNEETTSDSDVICVSTEPSTCNKNNTGNEKCNKDNALTMVPKVSILQIITLD